MENNQRPEVAEVAKLYEAEFEAHGYSLAAIMIPKGAQEARYQSKLEIGLRDGDSVLDVGCGFGHMLDYIKLAGYPGVAYTGVDICPPFIRTAQELHPGADFRLLDILSEPPAEQWDWGFLVGAFNLRFENGGNWEFCQQMIERMFSLCRKGVAVDFLTSYVDFQQPAAFHASPEEAFAFAKTLTKRAAIRHDYMPFEFSLYLYKDQAWNSMTVFSDYQEQHIPNLLR